MPTRALWAAVLLAALAGGCDEPPEAPPEAEAAPDGPLAEVADAFDECRAGDLQRGLRQLDAVVRQSPRDPDALVARGLCRWSWSSTTGDDDDLRGAYQDLSDAIEAVDGGAESATPLDQIYSRRAYVAQALDGAWVRALEDLDHAVALAPGDAGLFLDRAVARRSAGRTAAARADLRRFVALPDTVLPDRQRVAEALLDDLERASEPEP